MTRPYLVEDVEVQIGARLFVIGASVSSDPEAGVDVEVTDLDEAPATPGATTPYGIAVPVTGPERARLLAEHEAAFRDAVLDRCQAEAERAYERSLER